MKKLWMMGLAALMMLGSAAAQTSAGSQTSGSASSNTSATADKQGAQASTSSAASASQDASVTNKNKQTKAAASGASSSSASASASKKGAAANLASGSTMKAELTRPLDVKKNKVGDQVMARTTEDVKSDGQVVIPRGSKLIGHVTQAKQKAKGESESSLGIVFDRAVPKNGQEVPVHAVVQALAAGEAQATTNEVDTMASGSGLAMAQADAGNPMARPVGSAAGGGGLVGGVGSTVNSTAGMATSAAGNVGGAVNSTVNSGVGAAGSAAGLNTAGQLTSASSGVVGLQGLNLSSAASNSTQGSVITSADRNVRLESGTQMLLRVAAE